MRYEDMPENVRDVLVKFRNNLVRSVNELFNDLTKNDVEIETSPEIAAHMIAMFYNEIATFVATCPFRVKIQDAILGFAYSLLKAYMREEKNLEEIMKLAQDLENLDKEIDRVKSEDRKLQEAMGQMLNKLKNLSALN